MQLHKIQKEEVQSVLDTKKSTTVRVTITINTCRMSAVTFNFSGAVYRLAPPIVGVPVDALHCVSLLASKQRLTSQIHDQYQCQRYVDSTGKTFKRNCDKPDNFSCSFFFSGSPLSLSLSLSDLENIYR